MILGKRSGSFRNPPTKRKWSNSNKRKVKPITYGPGYNPKAVSGRKPPPNGELKYHDKSNISGFAAAAGGIPVAHTVQSLVTIQQGDQPYERNGNQILVRKLTVRGAVQLLSDSSDTLTNIKAGTEYFRWMIIIDTQCNGIFPDLTNIFEEDPTGQDQLDIYNGLSETGRFKVLMDKYIEIPPITAAFNTSTNHYHIPNRAKKFKKTFNLNLPVRYYNNTANFDSLRTNNIFMVVFTGASSTTRMDIQWRSRGRFTDY